ncbi:hypothetical protein V1508DRAFT_398854 [Lipomyces doorenjongii]|uniref:uncharacterized protein n=1 Tax=Lipomyces doorenjongii TaxID=383834 RepID=UPI0034CD52F9
MSSADERLQEVPPEPLPDYTDVPENGDRTIEDQDLMSSEPSATSMPTSPSSDRPKMTDVLNSSPEAPVSPKLDRTSSVTTAVKEFAHSQSGATQTGEIADTETETPPPARPPRPLSPFSEAHKTLKEAFPNVDESVIKAVLIASGGQIHPAFNALLSMSDPGFKPDLPARPKAQKQQPNPNTQLEADEAYARRLAKELNGGSQLRSSRRSQAVPQRDGASSYEKNSDQRYRRSQNSGHGNSDYYDGDSDKNWSFFDDDLPIIKDNLVQGFNETRTRVNEWVANFKKKLDGDDTRTDYYATAGSGRAYSSTARPASYNYRIARQSSYDNDPTELDGNFSHLNLVDDAKSSSKPPPKPARPLANPGLYKTRSPTQATSRGPFLEDDEDLYTSSAPLPARSSMATKSPASPIRNSGKWEPLTAVEPTPDKDPFFIGDSDDEEKAASEETKKQVRFAHESDDLK